MSRGSSMVTELCGMNSILLTCATTQNTQQTTAEEAILVKPVFVNYHPCRPCNAGSQWTHGAKRGALNIFQHITVVYYSLREFT